MNEKEIEKLIDYILVLRTVKEKREDILKNESREFDGENAKIWSEPYNLGYIEGLKLALCCLEPIMDLLDSETKKKIQKAIKHTFKD